MSSWQIVADVALAGGIAACVTHLLVAPVVRLANRLEAVDEPGGRRTHRTPRPRMGGLAMTLGMSVGFGATAAMRWPGWNPSLGLQAVVILGVATSLVFAAGVLDDVAGISALRKLAAQIVAACLLVAGGWKFVLLGLPGGWEVELGALGGLLTVIWIVSITNAINLLDGLDGLAAGVIAIIGASFIVYSLVLGNAFGAVLLAAILGACLGFLPHNWSPAKLFMGDAGSQTFGFLLAAASVHTSLKAPTAVAILVPLLALGVPIIDTGMVIVTRFLEPPKARTFDRVLRVFHADRNHLHHLMQSIVSRRRDVVRWIYVLVLCSSAFAVVTAVTRRADVGLVVLLVELIAVALIRRSGLAGRAAALSRERRSELLDLPTEEAPKDADNVPESGPTGRTSA